MEQFRLHKQKFRHGNTASPGNQARQECTDVVCPWGHAGADRRDATVCECATLSAYHRVYTEKRLRLYPSTFIRLKNHRALGVK